MGGFIATRRKGWYCRCKGFLRAVRRLPTLRRLNGRDMNALAIGLDENTDLTIWKPALTRWGYLALNWMCTGYPTNVPAG